MPRSSSMPVARSAMLRSVSSGPIVKASSAITAFAMACTARYSSMGAMTNSGVLTHQFTCWGGSRDAVLERYVQPQFLTRTLFQQPAILLDGLELFRFRDVQILHNCQGLL